MNGLEIKILYILHSSSKYEGANRSILNTLIGLKAEGVKLYIMMPETLYDISLYDELKKQNIQFYILKYYKAIWPARTSWKDLFFFIPRLGINFFSNLLTLVRLKQIVIKNKIDLVHTNVGPMLMGYYVCKMLQLPHVWHLREYQDLDFKYDTYYKKKRFIELIKSKNNFPIPITKGIARHFELPSTKVIYNGVLPQSSSHFVGKKEKKFIYVGNLSPNKGLDILLDAYVAFHRINNQFKLCIVGDTGNIDYKQKLISLVEKHDLTNSIEFLGKRDDVTTLMSNSMALIVPSLFEGFGRITAEAMLSGCLVIGRNTGGTQEILQPKKLGLLFNDQEELVEAMIKISKISSEEYSDIIEIAFREANEKYSNEVNVRKTLQLYTTILNSSPSEL